MLWTRIGTRDGRVWHVFFLRALITIAPRCARHRRHRARWLPGRRRMDRVAYRGARHVRVGGRAGQSAVHCVRLPPPRPRLCVDPARGLVGCALCWEQGTGSFQALSEPGPHRGRIAGAANGGNASNRAARFCLRCPPAIKAYDMKI
jgi:hypothetical protein